MILSAGFYVFILGAAGVVSVFLWMVFRDRSQYQVPKKFPVKWKGLLQGHVHFYQNLDDAERLKYERKTSDFLKKVRITGVRLKVTDLDRLLVASSAVIPLFNFPRWGYNNLHEVLLYPNYFDSNFSTDGPKETISGMVGSGRNMDGVMILNKKSLHRGFSNATDKKNVGIHEFVHIIDKADGEVDGIPMQLNDKRYAAPWLKLMHKEMERIRRGTSDIDSYGGISEQEFLAVASEYFFERPELFETRHPELYQTLRKIYHQDMKKRLKSRFKRKKRGINRNEPCPCGSGEKFKNCCMKSQS